MNNKQNIILIGMPGCGKSTLGKALAKRLGRDFYDADDVIVEQEGKTCLLYTSPSPRDLSTSRMPSSA